MDNEKVTGRRRFHQTLFAVRGFPVWIELSEDAARDPEFQMRRVNDILKMLFEKIDEVRRVQ